MAQGDADTDSKFHRFARVSYSFRDLIITFVSTYHGLWSGLREF